MDRGEEGKGHAKGVRKLNAFSEGLVAGVFAPVAGLAAWAVSGGLGDAIADEGAYLHLPAFAMTALPAIIAGGALAMRWFSSRDLFRASIGALASATLVGAVVLWFSYGETALLQRLLIAVSGGSALVGFWVWVGVGLGEVFGRTWCSRPMADA